MTKEATATTSTIGTPERPMSLSDLSSVLLNRTRVPVGFFVSQKLWDAVAARWQKESNILAPVPNSFHGTKIAIDPDLPDTEFNVAFTEEAWTKRLREIRGNGEDGST